MKIPKILLAVLLAAGILCAPAGAWAAENEAQQVEKPSAPVTIADDALRAALHEKTGIPASDPLRKSDLSNISGELGLKGKGITNAEGLQYCVNVEKLDLSENSLSALPDLSALTRLTSLDLHLNQLAELPETLLSPGKLQSLDLSGNKLGELPAWFAKIPSLSSLNLANNNFGAFPAALTSLFRLEKLDISGNPIGKLPDNLSEMLELKYLSANDCGLAKLPSGLFNMTWLRALSLQGNRLSSLSKSIDKLPNLESLSIAGNVLEILPDEICSLPKLEALDVSANALTALPAGIGRLPLQEFYARLNGLSALPESISYLTRLKKLDLRFNSFTRLPKELGSLPLEYFNMEWNFMDISDGTANAKALDAIKAAEKFFTHQLSPVKDLEAVSRPASVTLQWQPCTEGNDKSYSWKVDKYTIYSVSGGDATLIVQLSPTALSYDIRNLAPSKPYQFKVSVEYTVANAEGAEVGATRYTALIDVKTEDLPATPPPPQPSVSAAPSVSAPTPPPSVIPVPVKVPVIPGWLIMLLICVGTVAVASIVLVIVLATRKKNCK